MFRGTLGVLRSGHAFDQRARDRRQSDLKRGRASCHVYLVGQDRGGPGRALRLVRLRCRSCTASSGSPAARRRRRPGSARGRRRRAEPAASRPRRVGRQGTRRAARCSARRLARQPSPGAAPMVRCLRRRSSACPPSQPGRPGNQERSYSRARRPPVSGRAVRSAQRADAQRLRRQGRADHHRAAAGPPAAGRGRSEGDLVHQMFALIQRRCDGDVHMQRGAVHVAEYDVHYA
jgi:hypothetical protein